MKIEFYTVGGSTYIEAFFESDDHLESNRLEGAGVKITNRNPMVFFDQVYENIHPDVVGLICLAIFYPFIGKSVTLPFPVSRRLADSINRQIFTKSKTIEIRNIDESLKVYEGNGKAVLAFGGGMDSSAIRALFPDAYLVHEASIRNGELIPDKTNELMTRLNKEDKGVLVKTNSRYISEPGGWHIWIGSMITSLLEAAKGNYSLIYAGTILGSAYMSNGAKYFDRQKSAKWHGASGNYWQQIFWDIGLPLVQPLMGCSEILTLKASCSKLPRNEIYFCTANNGDACGICAKCFRRACIDEFVTGKSVDFTRFENPDVIRVLDRKPTYFGHIYASLMAGGWIPPAFAKERLSHLPKKTEFALKYNPESIDFMPESLKDIIKNVLDENFEVMNDDDIEIMKNWDQTKKI